MVIVLESKKDFEDFYLDQNNILGREEDFLGSIKKI